MKLSQPDPLHIKRQVSVIIPTWNRAATLEKAVRSALNQTLPPLEVLVCDDGSGDGSRAIAQGINDYRVRWLEGQRGGRPAIPRNRGIRESRGEWLAFLDSDDEWRPEKLERQVALAEKSGCRAVCSNASRFIPGQGIVGNYLAWEHERITFDDLLCVNQVICSSSLLDRSLVGSVQGFPEEERLKAVEDYALWLRVATLTDFAFVADPLVIYRDDAGSSIRNNDMDYWRQRQSVLADFETWATRERINRQYLKKARASLRSDNLNRTMNMLLAPLTRLKKALFE